MGIGIGTEYEWKSEEAHAQAYAKYIREYGTANWALLHRNADERAHFGSLAQSEKNWHTQDIGEKTADHQGNADRQYYDEGLNIAGKREAFGITIKQEQRLNAMAERSRLMGRINGFELHAKTNCQTAELANLCSARVQTMGAGMLEKEAREYLDLSEAELEHLDGIVKEPFRLKSKFFMIPMLRKRAPKAGWASEVLRRTLYLKNPDNSNGGNS